MYEYFRRDDNDARFFAQYIEDRLPRAVFDAHVHVNLPAHVAAVSREAVMGDWAMQCGTVLPYGDALEYQRVLFPGRKMGLLALPMPLGEADLRANNAYLAAMAREGKTPALMAVRPEWSAEDVERQLTEGKFAGLKPYPYMAAAAKGADVGIFEFLPHAHLEVADRHGSAVLLHLPRKGRLADRDNVREIRAVVQKYPRLRLVLAHYGRCFTVKYLKEGLDLLGEDRDALWFDTAAVSNPDVHAEALQRLRPEQILYGTDLPVFLWHGRRRWTETAYVNLCREDFPWNRHADRENEAGYTFYLYEQLKAMLDCLEKAGAGRETVEGVFHGNAAPVYRPNEE